ncbi:Uu.00g001590.m01.CDS01 [Anthostomella pinea]|uniref:Cytoplasmic tRNA 2-thiolation protein 2 n=1 Tax=Anthostomella pinea TaxID=933095 RepID=A0AAI8YII4_9PEZI|nr:Uu.00g001590.m01.CDS01 [Anthostomella pinea]
MATEAASPQPCNRCKEQPATQELRTEQVCKTCFATFVATKAVKRLEVQQRETRGTRPPTTQSQTQPSHPHPQRYLLALSGGPSSAALLHIVCSNARRQQQQRHERKGKQKPKPRFEIVVVHVDVSLSPFPQSQEVDSNPLLDGFRAAFPDAVFHSIPLAKILESRSIDWSSLPPLPPDNNDSLTPSHRLASLLNRLPSPSSRSDVQRLFVRHLLLNAAVEHACDVLLLGYSTTALAELTLAETAKGRGFALPWMVNDGVFPVPRSLTHPSTITITIPIPDTKTQTQERTETIEIPVYSPLRELFRKELRAYLSNENPELAAVAERHTEATASASGSGGGSGAVVSHRDLSIDDVMARYFAEVETAYPSVVANVVRTTGKLARGSVAGGQSRAGSGGEDEDEEGDEGDEEKETRCGLCNVPLDAAGDERWRGEIGDDEMPATTATTAASGTTGTRPRAKLCYGCERSVRG